MSDIEHARQLLAMAERDLTALKAEEPLERFKLVANVENLFAHVSNVLESSNT
jgi:hypothetical protein